MDRVSEADLNARQAERRQADVTRNCLVRAYAIAQADRFDVSRQHDTLRRFPRTLDEAFPNQREWTTAEAAIAEEDFIRQAFADPVKPLRSRAHKWADRCIWLICVGTMGWVLLAFVFGWVA